jgi:ABC-type transporter Mla maintaining outer membrane lipid asymmetry permease subunit MlaE
MRGIWKFFAGKRKSSNQEFAAVLEDVGMKALPIAVLISFLVGPIVSFISIS